MALLRLAGQEASVAIINVSTGDQAMPDVLSEKWSFSILSDIVQKLFIGDIGPQFRSFSNGYEGTISLQYNSAEQMVAFYNAIIAKNAGSINDIFSVSGRVNPPG